MGQPEVCIAGLIRGDRTAMVSEPSGKNRLSLVDVKQSPRNSSIDTQSGTVSSGVQVREVRTRDEKDKLYRFRHLMSSIDLDHVDHHSGDSRKRVKDELDIDAVNLVALHQSQIVGAVRINHAWRCALGIHADFYRMREMAGTDHPARTCVASRLLVHPAFRHETLGYRLCAAAYKHALARDARYAFLHCADDLIYYFSVLGFKAYMGRTLHREFGEVIPMKLDLLDEQYLMQIGSPLLPVLRGWKQSKQACVKVLPA
jgi:GNAT superfamily N-acetyltransferase